MLGRNYIVMRQDYKAVYETGPNYLKQKKNYTYVEGEKDQKDMLAALNSW